MARPLIAAIEQAMGDCSPAATSGAEGCRHPAIRPLIITQNGEHATWRLRFSVRSIRLDMSTGTTSRVEAMMILEAVRLWVAEYQLKASSTKDEARARLGLQDIVETDCGCGKQRCGLTTDDQDEDELRTLTIRESGNSLVVLATMLSLSFWVDHKSNEDFIIVHRSHIDEEAPQ